MRDSIGAIYAQVDAPAWAGHNLDALFDVLTDLSWLPPGPVEIRLEEAPWALIRVLRLIEDETAGSARPVRIRSAH